jgi:hypothetical protein
MYKDDKQNSIDGYLHESTFRVPRNAVAKKGERKKQKEKEKNKKIIALRECT